LREVGFQWSSPREIRIAYFDYSLAGTDGSIPILLLHGSPGSGEVLKKLAESFHGTHRLIAPDLPGFGNSTHEIADYSIRAHAIYMWAAE
jgi:pimeloyl-ACP methyl ester carboxylesterase